MTNKMFSLDRGLDAEMKMQSYNKVWCQGHWESVLFIPISLYYYVIGSDLRWLFIIFKDLKSCVRYVESEQTR